ncbi:uncharacterized protein LOC126552404 [Aphis gossypii]|uniref:uncharacterized protein LOC126552404 n=1 Tax=Aphis gossypii TaxID=80765 RepID=UPI00215946A2|nr:uncharacterized protein LOC126552404 [Aphis gossypii]
MGDRHKTPRLYKSGSQKRKLAADRQKNSEESLSSIPKLTNYFSTSRLLAKNSSSQLTKDLVNVVDISNNQSEFDEKLDVQLQNNKVDVNTDPVLQLGFENYIGPLTNNLVTNVVNASKNDPEYNCDEELFEKSSVIQDRCERPDHGSRKCSINLFKRISKNKEIVNRFWLCFSPSTGKIYCYVCKLLETNQGNISNNGALTRVIILSQRGKEIGCIDKSLKQQMNEEESGYWNKILMRVVSTIKFLCERGLALRGQNEIIGSSKNGNYLGILELIAEYDPFLSAHIKKHANKGSGHTNYLSSTICEELVS